MQTESFFGLPIDTGKRSSREVEEFNMHPNTIKSLSVGDCVVKKYPEAGASRIKISFNREGEANLKNYSGRFRVLILAAAERYEENLLGDRETTLHWL